MKVSEAQIFLIKPDEGLVGFATCVLEDAYFISSIAIYTKLAGGIRLVFPTKLVGGRQMHLHHPISQQAHRDIQKAIEEKYAAIFHTSA